MLDTIWPCPAQIFVFCRDTNPIMSPLVLHILTLDPARGSRTLLSGTVHGLLRMTAPSQVRIAVPLPA